MKKIAALLFIGCAFLGTVAQKNAKTAFSTIDKKVVFSPTIIQLTKETNYAVQMPAQLKYFYGEQTVAGQVWNPYQASIQTDARVHTVKPDFIFRFISTGMKNIKEGAVRWHRNDIDGTRGFVKDITYSFPASLEVFDVKKNAVIKRIEVVPESEEFAAVFQSAWATGGWAPFADQAALNSSFLSGMDAFYKSQEKKTAGDVCWRISMAITFMYDEYNNGKTYFGYGYVKPKDREHDYADIDTLNEKYKLAVELATLNKDNFQAAASSFSALRTAYEKILNSHEARIDINVKNILHCNISWCALLSGDIEGAESNYRKCFSPGMNFDGRAAEHLRVGIQLFSLRHKTRI